MASYRGRKAEESPRSGHLSPSPLGESPAASRSGRADLSAGEPKSHPGAPWLGVLHSLFTVPLPASAGAGSAESSTPASKRQRGYYALPLLWRDRVIGWGNVSVKDGKLESDVGFVASRPRDPAFRRDLDGELERIRIFLGLE